MPHIMPPRQVELGEFGAWQQTNSLLLWLPAIAAGANVMVTSYTALHCTMGYTRQ